MSADSSKALQYVISKGWNYRITDTQIVVETCPCCGNGNWKFFMSYEPSKDGLYSCKVCAEEGSLYQLRQYLQDSKETLVSVQDAANSSRQPAQLPNVEAYHKALLEEDGANNENTALDYLIDQRGYTMDVIEKYKLGVVTEYGKRWLSIPYFQGGKLVTVKFRTLPPFDKEFRGIQGREAPLYNGSVLAHGMDELLVVEGEADALSCLSNGIENVVGIPGANLKKMSWIAKIDDVAPKSIYLLYDNDRVGQEAAKKMAARIGFDKCRNIVLPEFTYTDGNGEEKAGKDINEFFRSGKSIEDLNVLKAQAKQFDVEGVANVASIVQAMRDNLANGGTLEPKYVPRSPSLRKLVKGFEDGDLIGIMAEGKVGKTTWAQQILDELSEDYAEPSFMFCQEMPPDRSVRKWICNVTDTDTSEITLQTVDDAMQIALTRKADYLFGYTRNSKYQEIFETIRQTVRRYGVKFVCFDNLQILCRNIEHSTQETSVITKAFKQLAMELGIVIFLIIQPHRVREGEIISARNAHGSSAIEKDVDTMICLHRERVGKVSGEEFSSIGFLEVEENFAEEMLVRVDLCRYAAGGATTVRFLGGKSKVIEMSYQDRADKNSLVPINDQITKMNVPQVLLEAA